MQNVLIRKVFMCNIDVARTHTLFVYITESTADQLDHKTAQNCHGIYCNAKPSEEQRN